MTVRWYITMSADGFVADPRGALDWMFTPGPVPNPVAEAMVRTCGAFVCGRTTVRTAPAGSQVFGGGWDGQIIVLTHSPPESTGQVTFLSGGVHDAVAQAVGAAGDKDVVITGSDVAGQCAEAGLVDELVLHVAPVLLGDGTRLFARPGGQPLQLTLLETSQSGDITNLRYRVGR
jgi:dihydrofolate reductase